MDLRGDHDDGDGTSPRSPLADSQRHGASLPASSRSLAQGERQNPLGCSLTQLCSNCIGTVGIGHLLVSSAAGRHSQDAESGGAAEAQNSDNGPSHAGGDDCTPAKRPWSNMVGVCSSCGVEMHSTTAQKLDSYQEPSLLRTGAAHRPPDALTIGRSGDLLQDHMASRAFGYLQQPGTALRISVDKQGNFQPVGSFANMSGGAPGSGRRGSSSRSGGRRGGEAGAGREACT